MLLKSKIEKRREREDECNEVLTPSLSQLDRPNPIQENPKFWRESIRGNLARVQDLECVTSNIIYTKRDIMKLALERRCLKGCNQALTSGPFDNNGRNETGLMYA